MTGDVERAEFRRRATALHRRIMAALFVLPFGTGGLGWLVFGLWGLVIGAAAGLVLAAAGAVAVTLLWAMSQDGA